jgi:hypothetical protein
MSQKVTLYKATGDHGQFGIHSLEAEDCSTYYRIESVEDALSSHVPAAIVPKNSMGDLSLTRAGALVKFLCHLEDWSADLERALKGIQALRSQALTIAEAEGIEIDMGDETDIGDPGAEAEGLDAAHVRALGEADYGDGTMSPEQEEKKAALNRGQP